MSGSFSFNRHSFELRGAAAADDSQEKTLLTNTTASQRRRQCRAEQTRQESWFRHSMPPAINREFESIENLTQNSSGNVLDEQLATSFTGKLPTTSASASVSFSASVADSRSDSLTVCGGGSRIGGLNLNSANSNLGFIDSDEPNTPVTPLHSTSASLYDGMQHHHGSASAASCAGTLSSSNAAAAGGSSATRRKSKGSVLSKQSANSIRSHASALAARGLRITASFIRKKRKEYEGEFLWVSSCSEFAAICNLSP